MKKLIISILVLLAYNSYAQTCNDYTITGSGIPDDNNWYYWTINVPESGYIQDVDITFNITHLYNDDLDIVLGTPSGTQVLLSMDNGGSSDNYNNVTFDDSAQEIISDSTPISGYLRPEEPLIKIRGESMFGDWRIYIRDDTAGDTGTLNNVTLRICTMGYTGPGGVGDSETNVLWLRSEDLSLTHGTDISLWSDISGHSNIVTQSNSSFKPIYRNSGVTNVNSFPLVEFSRDENRIRKTNFNNFPSTEITAVYVNRTNEADGDGILSYASSSNDNDFLLYSSDALELEIDGINKVSTKAFNNGVWNIANVSWKSSDGLREVWKNGAGIFSNFQQGKSITNDGCFAIGNDQDGIDTYHNFWSGNDTHTGDFTEIILYNTFLNDAQNIIISNYLSAKYNVFLEANNIYTQDENGDFDFNVAGIGEFNSGKHVDSQGTGIVRINTPSSLADNNFLFWGENVKEANYTFSTTGYSDRIDTKWRVSKFNNLGTVSVHIKGTDINLGGITITACTPLKLIVSSDANFTTKTSYDMTLSGGVYTATGVDFTDDDYFTLEYFDTIVVDNTKFYNGSGTNNVPNMDDGCYKLLVKNNADGLLALTENALVKSVEVESGGKLVINNDKSLTVAENIVLNGEIRMLGNSQLVQTHTGVGNVTGTGNLFMDKTSNSTNIYQSSYWSSPVSTNGSVFSIGNIMKDGTTATTNDSTPGDITFVTGHDGSTSPVTISSHWLAKVINNTAWDMSVNENTAINIVEGYNMKSTGVNQPNFTFVGKPNDGEYLSAITTGKTSLLGNPYPSAMNADTFLSDNSPTVPTTLFDTLYYWDSVDDNGLTTHVGGAYDGGFATYKSGTGTKFNNGSVPTNIIPVGQGFMIDGLNSGNITFNNSQRVANTSGSFFARPVIIPLIRLGLTFSIENERTFHRQLAVSFRDASNNFDARYDALMYDMRPTDMSIKAGNTSNDYVIKALENYSDELVVPLYIRLDKKRTLTFSIDAIENIEINQVYLKNAETNQYYDLLQGVELTLNAGDYSDQYSVVFRAGVAAINDLAKDNTITVIDTTESVTISSNLVIKSVTVFNILGQEILSKVSNSNQVNLVVQEQKEQVLLIKVTLENGQEITKKIIKK